MSWRSSQQEYSLTLLNYHYVEERGIKNMNKIIAFHTVWYFRRSVKVKCSTHATVYKVYTDGPDLTSVYSRLSFAQPFSHWLWNHPVQEVVGFLHLVVQHLHALLQLTGLFLLLQSQQRIGDKQKSQLRGMKVIERCHAQRRAATPYLHFTQRQASGSRVKINK